MCFATSQAAKIIITLLESYVNRKLSLFIKLSIILCSNFIIVIHYEKYLTVEQDSNSEPPPHTIEYRDNKKLLNSFFAYPHLTI